MWAEGQEPETRRGMKHCPFSRARGKVRPDAVEALDVVGDGGASPEEERMLESLSLDGTSVVITRGGTGLGRAMVRDMSRAGAHLVIAGRRTGPGRWRRAPAGLVA